MKHFIIEKAEGKFRMAKQQRGEEEASTERARKKREHDYSPGEERFKERSKRRKEEMGEMAND
jgi:hypothetical protein